MLHFIDPHWLLALSRREMDEEKVQGYERERKKDCGGRMEEAMAVCKIKRWIIKRRLKMSVEQQHIVLRP